MLSINNTYRKLLNDAYRWLLKDYTMCVMLLVILFLGLVNLLVAYNITRIGFFDSFTAPEKDLIFFKMEAAAWQWNYLLIGFLIWLLMRVINEYVPSVKTFWMGWARIPAWFALSNLLDDFMNNNTKINYTEFGFAALVVFFEIYNYRQWQKRLKTKR